LIHHDGWWPFALSINELTKNGLSKNEMSIKDLFCLDESSVLSIMELLNSSYAKS
jgi:hypothetical protein